MSREAERVLEILEDMASDVTARVEGDVETRAMERGRLIASMETHLLMLCRLLGADEVVRLIERHREHQSARLFGHDWRRRARERREEPDPVEVALDREVAGVVR